MKRKGNLLLSEFRFLHSKTPWCDSFAEILELSGLYFFGGTSLTSQRTVMGEIDAAIIFIFTAFFTVIKLTMRRIWRLIAA